MGIFGNGQNTRGNKVVKASSWYIICSFVTNALSFITAPIFARIMSEADYGQYSNFVSWYGIISCIATLSLHATIVRARYDFEEDFHSYIASMLMLGTTNTIALYIIVAIFRNRAQAFFNMDFVYISLIFLCLVFQPANAIFQAIQRLEYKYKTSVFLTVASALLTSVVSVSWVFFSEEKLRAKIFGSQVPALIINIGLYIYLMYRGRRVKIEHWKYAYVIAIPYIPHLLAGTMLNSLDRVMLTDIVGAEATAIYSIAGNCASIMTIFSTSINLAIQPWIAEKIHDKQYGDVRKATNIAVLFFTLICIYIILLSKEVVYVLGGEKYSASCTVIPPLILGCLLQFIYTFYVSVEQYEKKTIGMAVATLIAAALNWGMNSIFIPRYSYVAAAYTTFISYLVLLIIHFWLVKRLKLDLLFDIRVFGCFVIVIGIFCVIIKWMNAFVRYSIILLLTVTIGIIACKYASVILEKRNRREK